MNGTGTGAEMAEGASPIIRAIGLRRGFPGLQVLDGLDFELSRGEFVAIVGRSGVGKSTLLGVLGTHDTDFAGSLVIDGIDVSSASRQELATLRRGVIGFVFQDFHLLPHLSPVENVVLPAVFCGRDYESAVQSASELLTHLGVRIQDQASGLLSRGERQRVAVARGVLGNPAVLLADEPTASLDEDTEGKLFDMIDDLRAESGFALVSVVHSSAIRDRADRVLELKNGRLGSP